MGLLGKEKKHKKNGRRKYSENKKYFSKREKYKDEYEDEEYYEDEYYEEESEEYYEDEYHEEESGGHDIRDGHYADGYEDTDGGEYYEEEYYGDESDYYEEAAEDNGYYEEDEDLSYYVEDGEYEGDDDEEEDFVAYRKKRGIPGAILAFRNLPLIDKVIVFTGVAVLVFAVITGTIFMAARNEDKAVAAFTEVGASLNGIKIIGESGLLAVADAQMAKEAAAEVELEEETQIVEEEKVQGANVALKMTSIVKDLKIKIINVKSDKLVANVPFQVEVTMPSKKTETWTDDDKDGVIYKENIEAGTYQVKMLELAGEYADYKVSAETQKVEVKANIDYKKVDVKEEIKTEAEVNAAVEDTVAAKVEEESKLTDTVPFVKSTQTKAGEASYQKVDKSTIKDPGATARIETARYYLMTNDAGGSSSSGDSGNSSNTGNSGDGGNSSNSGDAGNSSNSGDAGNSSNTGNSGDAGNSSNTSEPPKQEEPKPETKLSITSTVSVEAGKKTSISVTENTTSASVEWRSDNESVATVSSSGEITGVASGTATITATAGGKTATCTVTVNAAPERATLTINPTSLSLIVGGESTVTADSNQNNVTWASKADVASVTPSGDTKSATVKAIKAGEMVITVTAGDVVQTCTVRVTDAGITVDKTSVQVQIQKTADIKVTTVPEGEKIKEVLTAQREIATATFQDKTVTVTGVALGKTEITIRCENGKEAKVAVEVINNAMLDTTSLLKDKNGNQVYVYENGQYRKAVYADYYKFEEFYLETQEILYTGWQDIDGKTYYYLENHQYVTGEQIIQGAKYTFADDGVLVTNSGTFGIDVSKWNGSIDWNSVKSSGVSYAIIRCGYRGSTTGALITDPKFSANISGANAAGIKTGVYFFTQAINEKEAVEEASMVLDLVKKYKISYPIFLDVEPSGGRADGIDKATRTAVCKAFCATIQNSGYTAGIYANKTWLGSKMDAGALGSYKIWLAQYAAAPSYGGKYNLWQYSSKGAVPGIKGNVDLNLSYLGF